LDHHTDFTVKLITDTKHSSFSLYEWCLQEFNNDGEQVGRDLTPWDWSLNFDVTNLLYTYSLKGEDTVWFRLNKDEQEGVDKGRPPIRFEGSESIGATLVPAKGRYGRTSYSMAGADREITDIHLRIVKAEADGCVVWGSVSSTFELEFRQETTDDVIDILLRLTPDKFGDLAQMINSGEPDGGTLRLSGVLGFYSNWSPEISTDFIKVLTDDQQVEIPEDAEIDPPRLGTVREFQFWLNNNHKLTSGDKVGSVDYGWAEKQTEAEVRSVSNDYDNRTPKLNEERAGSLRRTPKYELLMQMLRDASSYGAMNNLDPDALADLAGATRSFFTELGAAFQKDSWHDYEDNPHALTDHYERTWNLWHHRQIRFDEIKKGEVPHIDRGYLTQAVAQYLDLPIRNRRMDRMLVDALVAAEVIAFADKMLNIPTFLRDLSASPLVKSHPLWRFVKGQFFSLLVVAAIPIGLLVGAVNVFDMRGEWPLFVGLGFASLWALFFVIGLAALPGFWISDTKRKRKVSELLVVMGTVYTEIGIGTVVSARHIRERLDKNADQGAVWPSEVFSLLDDIIDRGGVM
jgi:hypothetical protein